MKTTLTLLTLASTLLLSSCASDGRYDPVAAGNALRAATDGVNAYNRYNNPQPIQPVAPLYPVAPVGPSY